MMLSLRHIFVSTLSSLATRYFMFGTHLLEIIFFPLRKNQMFG